MYSVVSFEFVCSCSLGHTKDTRVGIGVLSCRCRKCFVVQEVFCRIGSVLSCRECSVMSRLISLRRKSLDVLVLRRVYCILCI